MSSLAKYYGSKLRGFFSYSREDDVDFNQVLSRFRACIQAELGAQLGRNRDNFDIWQDKFAIPEGALWQNKILEGINESAFFIPVITPRVVNSPHCLFEFKSFLDREKEFGRDDLVFPILYIGVPELEDGGAWQQNDVLKIVKARQYLDWREYRYKPLDAPEVAERIGRFCQNIANAMRKQWLSPEERQQQQDAATQRILAQELQHRTTEIAVQQALEDEKNRQADKAEQRRREEALANKRAAEEAAFVAAKSANTVAALDAFLDANSGSDFASEAQKLREALLARQETHRQAMASDDVAALRSFCKTYKSGSDVDEVRARLRAMAPPAKLQFSRTAMAIAATIAAILCAGLVFWARNGSSPPTQQALVTPNPPSAPVKNPTAPLELSVTPSANAPVPSSAQKAEVPASQHPIILAEATPQAPAPTTPNPSSVPAKSLPMWATACTAKPEQTTAAVGGAFQSAKIKVVLTNAQQGAIAVRSVAISPDGKNIVTAGDDGIIRVWDATLKLSHPIAGGGSPVYSLAFSIDGNLLASAGFDGSVRIWDGHSFAPLIAPFTVPVKLYGVAFEAKNNPEYVLSVGADGMVRKWDWRTGQAKPPVRSGSGAHPTTGSLSFMPNESGSYATANFNGTIRFFDPGRTDTINAFPGGVALRLAYSPDDTLVATAGADAGGISGVKILDATTHALLKALPAHQGHAASVAWSRDGTVLATGGGFKDPSVALWDVQSGKQLLRFNGPADIEPKDVDKDVEAVAFFPNQKRLISASETGKIKIWDVATGSELLSVVAIPDSGDYVAYTPSGCYTGSANAANYVRYVTSEGDQISTNLLVPDGNTAFLLPQ